MFGIAKYYPRVFVILCFFLLGACSKNDPEPAFDADSGVVIGQDFRLCACCGGWFIDIEDQRYRFQVIPEGNTIDFQNETYPFEVTVQWNARDEPCLGDEIDVIRIEKVD